MNIERTLLGQAGEGMQVLVYGIAFLCPPRFDATPILHWLVPSQMLCLLNVDNLRLSHRFYLSQELAQGTIIPSATSHEAVHDGGWSFNNGPLNNYRRLQGQ